MRSGKRAFDALVRYEPDERHGDVGGEAGPPVGEGQADAQAVHQVGGLALDVGAYCGGEQAAVALGAQQCGLEYGVCKGGGQQHDAVGGTGIGGKWFSLIQAVATGMSDSQNSRCWLAHSAMPETLDTAASIWWLFQ